MVDTVIIHSPDHLRAVFDAARANGCRLVAVTAEWAGIAYGALYWAKAFELARTDVPDAAVDMALHCGADAGRALGALREGWNRIVFTGDARITRKIADIASQLGAEMAEEPDENALDLGEAADAAAALEAWLSVRRRCK